MTRRVYIRDAVRTPRGKARADGGLASLTPHELTRQALAALESRNPGVCSEAESLVLGCVGQVDAQGGHIALVSKLHCGLADTVNAVTLNNYCVSGLTALAHSAASVAAGQVDAALAGGVEMMSRVPFMGDNAAYYSDASFSTRNRYVPVALAADRLAAAENISRAELDRAALVSHQRAVAAEACPEFQRSRIAVSNLHHATLREDECPRPQTTAESLAAQEPAFGHLAQEYADALAGATFPALHTVSHAPPVCDGASLALLTAAPDGARANIRAFAQCGADPAQSLTAGFAAMQRALAQCGLTLDAMDRIEFMESFAVTIAKFLRDWRVDPAKVNVSGGHLAKGHPLGASGAILTSTLLDCLDECDGHLGLVVATGASGVGAAMIVERIS